MKKEHQCWNFVMSSFVRSYGVKRVMCEQKFHEVALQWCDDNKYNCVIETENLIEIDMYFKKIYETWEY